MFPHFIAEAHTRVILLMALSLLFSTWVTLATPDNIDPNNDGFQYAYGENVGWLNMQPLDLGGPGVLVSDSELTGWIWGENIGWISMSCENTSSCTSARYGVWNDTSGNLFGYAWGENGGWINFSPLFAGVHVDPETGVFSGRAWGENIGWITFGSPGPVFYSATTSWRCSPNPGPAGDTLQVTALGGAAVITWSDTHLPPAHYNTYVGTIGPSLMGGRPYPYDHACLENDNAAGDGRERTVDAVVPSLGDARYYLVSAERECEGSLGTATDARPRPNFNSCPDPP